MKKSSSIYHQINEYLEKNNYQISIPIEEFINETSNIYHAVESSDYNDRHHVMFEESSKFWRSMIADNVNSFTDELRVLDFGCGTGFELNVVLESSIKNRIKSITCFDISKDMLLKCKENVENRGEDVSDIDFDFIHSFENLKDTSKNSYDLILMNAILHHIPDLDSLFTFIKSVSSSSTILIIGHEPNHNFYKNKYLVKRTKQFQSYKKVSKLFSLRFWIKRFGFIVNKDVSIYEKTNEILLKKGYLNRDLPGLILSKMVDIHVPFGLSQQQVWGEIGFNDQLIISKYLNQFIPLDFKSYFHIKDYKSLDSYFWRLVTNRLAKKYPNDGADCIMMLKSN